MTTKDLSRYYEFLSPEERFQVFIGAMARDDVEEAQKLDHSCQRQTYKMTDSAFSDRIDASDKITLLFCSEIAFYLGRLDIAKIQKDSPITKDLRKQCELKVKTIWEGFNQFCNVHIGVDGQTMVMAWMPPVMDFLYMIDDEAVEVDRIASDEYNDTLVAIWQREIDYGEV